MAHSQPPDVSGSPGGSLDPAARRLLDAIAGTVGDLVRIPSQNPGDPPDQILAYLASFFETRRVAWRFVGDASAPVGIVCTIGAGAPGPEICLDACVDTAPVGDQGSWSVPPFEGRSDGRRLIGRGAADSKAAVAIFAHLADDLGRTGGVARGSVHFLFDADEHSGRFSGARRFFSDAGRAVSLVAIGYPGNDEVVIGGRGFFRGRLSAFGRELHSGSSGQRPGDNAIRTMARLVEELAAVDTGVFADAHFSSGPSLNVTEIAAGSGYSQLPGRCDAKLDVRLTPSAGVDWARSLVSDAIERVRQAIPGVQIVFEEEATEPAYRLDPDSSPVRALQAAAEHEFGRSPVAAVKGPSNIGNYLATLGIPSLSGFGVTYGGTLHGPDESIDIASILPVYRTYRRAVQQWLQLDAGTLKAALVIAGSG